MLRILRTPWNAALSPRDLANAVHRSVVVPVLRRRARRSAIAALEGMADLLLDDIGVSRHDIPKAVDGMLARDFPNAAAGAAGRGGARAGHGAPPRRMRRLATREA